MLQPLERRRMFAISVAAGLATINGTASDDVIEVILQSGKINVRNGAGTITDSVNSAGITKISVNGGGGNDFIRLGRNDGTLMPNLPSTLSGGAGNDTIVGGNKADQIFGGNNNDRIDGRAGGDIINGGSGFDTADYSYRTVPITVTLINSATANDGSNTGDNSAPGKYNDNGSDNCVDIENVVGGTAADKITGNDSANWLDGSGGNDSLYGLAGVDTITGGVNNDLGYGGTQDDFFFMKDVAADQFLGEGGLTSAQYDSGVDSPAPAQAAAAAKVQKAKLMQTIVNAEPVASNLVLDDTFDEDGKVVTIIDNLRIELYDVTIQVVPDVGEKIIAVGKAYTVDPESEFQSPSDFIVIRYNSDGTLDTTFGSEGTGMVFTDFSPPIEIVGSRPGTSAITAAGPSLSGFNDFANSVIIDSHGNIVVAGGSSPGDNLSYYAVARYTPDGILDTNFSFDGKTAFDANESSGYDYASRIIEEDFGSGLLYLIGGTVVNPGEGGTGEDFGIMRLTDGGDVDFSFDFVSIDFGGEGGPTSDYLSGMIVDPLYNAIWVSGTSYSSEFGNDFAVAGIYDGGTLIAGSETIIDFDSSDDYASNMTFDGDNLYIAGTSYHGEGASEGAVAKVPVYYTASRGTVETSQASGDGGILTMNYPTDGSSNNLNGITFDGLGNLYVVGTHHYPGMQVFQINPETLEIVGDKLDVNFVTPGETYGFGNAIAVQGDGKLVLVGNDAFSNYGLLARVNTGGEVWVDIPISDTEVQNFPFTYIDENGNTQPVPTYLVWRDTALKPDGTLDISGGVLGDVILIDQKGEFITITKNGEILQIPKEFVTKIVVNGGDGGDLIWTSEYVQVPVIIDGGKGGDTITGGNKKDSIYGGDGDDRIAAGDGNDFVDCGKGNDIALGGFGNDSVLGGDGRDILIGGDGVDTLKGGAGEDAILAGGTKYTYTPEIFEQIRKEWARTDVSYGTRVSHLVNGGGLNGTYLLNKNTVTSSNNLSDVLTGDADKDAFWANLTLPGDKITDKASGEIVTLVTKV